MSNPRYYFIIILIGMIFHLLFGYSIFDIYFRFPLDYGMTPHSSNLSEDEIPSNRIAIFILDGIRVDTFFESVASGKAPFLRNIIENRGVYGICNTKVPTETKPGFTAMFSGHFEDASLALIDLFNGDIMSDSIFNESNHAWGIGVDACLFAEGADNMDCVPFEGMQDYSDANAEKNDIKVFTTMMELFEKANQDKNSELYKNLHKNKISFLYHLIQTDTIGHKDGPKSQRLINHIIEMDSFFQKIEKAFNDFYQDSKTTFIITADHGMDIRHAHGDGNPECTRLPFVAWGTGIRKPIKREQKPPEEDTPSEWGLDNLVRHDISQIDIAPLSAGLIGSNFPMNSLGIIPIDFLGVSNKIKSKILFGNMMEIFEIYKIKNDIQNKSIIFKPYKPLIDHEKIINDIQNDINNEKYEEALEKTNKLINIILDGMNYILHYDRLYLQTLVTIGYVLWMIYIFIFVEMKNNGNLRKFFFFTCEEIKSTIISGVLTLILCIYLYIRLSPFTYYLYTLFSCYFLWRILSNLKYLKLFFILDKGNKKSTLQNICNFIIAFLLFLSLVSIYYLFILM